jgi:hypothetical protein
MEFNTWVRNQMTGDRTFPQGLNHALFNRAMRIYGRQRRETFHFFKKST